jgi:hypothetical protein
MILSSRHGFKQAHRQDAATSSKVNRTTKLYGTMSAGPLNIE